MSNEPTPNPWSRPATPAWDASAPGLDASGTTGTQYPSAPGTPYPNPSGGQYPPGAGASAAAAFTTTGTVTAEQPGQAEKPPKAGRSKIAGLVLATLLTGAVGGGAVAMAIVYRRRAKDEARRR